MAKLSDLSVELLELILSNFPSTDRCTLLRLCRTSKQLCSIAQPRLFREFSCARPRPWRDIPGSFSYRGSGPKFPLFYFTHTILMRPDLASKVRDIIIESYDNDLMYSADDEYLDTPSPEMMENFKRSLEGLPLLSDQLCTWTINLGKLEVTAVLALLLSRTPNAKSLHITLHSNPLTEVGYLTGKHIPGADGSLVPFCSGLTNLKVIPGNCNQSHRLQQTTPLLRLPALETFRAEGLLGYNEYKLTHTPQLDIEPGTLNISHLELFSSRRKQNSKNQNPKIELFCVSFDSPCLAALITGCKGLRTFRYRGDNPTLNGYPMKQVTPAEIQLALEPHKHSLERLEIDVGSVNYRLSEEGLERHAFTSFEGYTRLKRLDVPYTFAVGAEELPPSIEHLTMRGCKSGVFGGTARMVSLGIRPSLRTIEIDRFVTEYLYFQQWAGSSSLEEACQKMVDVLRGTEISVYASVCRSPPEGPTNIVAGRAVMVYFDKDGFEVKDDTYNVFESNYNCREAFW
ncbi:hypothetical protein FQN52_008459 [Onygenales sp. PD_12]|nr:hypothetical protein FQN52_008459 [Onygenales sp. PD_12]